jgi:hypothetical protein
MSKTSEAVSGWCGRTGARSGKRANDSIPFTRSKFKSSQYNHNCSAALQTLQACTILVQAELISPRYL